MTDLTRLDAKALQAFIDNDVAGFRKELEDIRKDTPEIPALKSLIQGYTTPGHLMENPVLAIGLLGADDAVHGKTLTAGVSNEAKAIDDVLAAQSLLFKHMKRDLQETIKTLLKNQDASLEAIGGEKLLDIFSDVDGDLSGGGAGSGKSAH